MLGFNVLFVRFTERCSGFRALRIVGINAPVAILFTTKDSNNLFNFIPNNLRVQYYIFLLKCLVLFNRKKPDNSRDRQAVTSYKSLIPTSIDNQILKRALMIHPNRFI